MHDPETLFFVTQCTHCCAFLTKEDMFAVFKVFSDFHCQELKTFQQLLCCFLSLESQTNSFVLMTYMDRWLAEHLVTSCSAGPPPCNMTHPWQISVLRLQGGGVVLVWWTLRSQSVLMFSDWSLSQASSYTVKCYEFITQCWSWNHWQSWHPVGVLVFQVWGSGGGIFGCSMRTTDKCLLHESSAPAQWRSQKLLPACYSPQCWCDGLRERLLIWRTCCQCGRFDFHQQIVFSSPVTQVMHTAHMGLQDRILVCTRPQLISHTTGPMGLILFVHISDCMLESDCDSVSAVSLQWTGVRGVCFESCGPVGSPNPPGVNKLLIIIEKRFLFAWWTVCLSIPSSRHTKLMFMRIWFKVWGLFVWRHGNGTLWPAGVKKKYNFPHSPLQCFPRSFVQNEFNFLRFPIKRQSKQRERDGEIGSDPTANSADGSNSDTVTGLSANGKIGRTLEFSWMTYIHSEK